MCSPCFVWWHLLHSACLSQECGVTLRSFFRGTFCFSVADPRCFWPPPSFDPQASAWSFSLLCLFCRSFARHSDHGAAEPSASLCSHPRSKPRQSDCDMLGTPCVISAQSSRVGPELAQCSVSTWTLVALPRRGHRARGTVCQFRG